MNIEEFRKAGHEAVDNICEYFASLENRPVVAHVSPGYLRAALPDAAPEEGEAPDAIVQDFQTLIMPGITHWQHPSFFAYFPANVSFAAMLGDMYAGSVSNPGFNWACSPAATELEAIVMDWAAKLFALDPAFLNSSERGGGVIQTTASDSALVVIVAARARYQRLHPSVPLADLVVYTSTQTHSLGLKGALVLGLAVRALPVSEDDTFSLRGETVRQALAEDKAAGKHPFILIATVGTTSSGAVDRLDEFASIVEEFPSLWIHVDAAWAGVALACPEFRSLARLDDINKCADSFGTNFHKWGLTNFDASALWVRDRKHLTDALDVTPEFLRTKHGDAGTVIDYRNWQFALGRRFRSLKIWFVLRSFGTSGFREHIRKGVKLAEMFASLLKASRCLQFVVPPSLALVVFRISPPEAALSVEDSNSINRIFFARLSTRPDIYLTHTDLNGLYCVRFAAGSILTEERHIRSAFETIEDEACKTWVEWKSENRANDM